MNLKKQVKTFFTIILSSILILFPFSGCRQNGSTTVKLNEVTHSVFYAPLYVAIENEYFKNENINIELTNGGGADSSMTAILSGTADIGLMGPETVIYVQSQGKKDAPVVFGQLTQKDGSFLVSRKDEPNFDWKNLKNKEILAGRRGGVPAMTFEYVLNEMGMKNVIDYQLNYDVQFNLMTSAFIGGTADYCTVFEPTASEYEQNGTWHVVASVGEKAGEIPYTSFIALNSYLKNNKNIVLSFLKAVIKGLDFINCHTDKEVAESIIKQFPSTTIDSLERSVKNYRKINAWTKNLTATEESFDTLQKIMINSGELAKKTAFEKLVNDSYINEVIS